MSNPFRRSVSGPGALTAGAFLLLALSQCGAPYPSDNTNVERSEIVAGTPVAQNNVGAVAVYHSSFSRPCSGTNLGDGWVLTARHCVTVDAMSASALLDPSEVFIVGTVSPGAARPPISSLPAGSFSNVSLIREFDVSVDIAMLKLVTPLSTTLVPPPIGRSAVSTSGHVGTTFLCEGYGRSMNLTNPDTPAGDATTGAGTLRSALLNVVARTFNPVAFDEGSRMDAPFQLQVGMNSSNQIVFHGDSGGPCFDNAAPGRLASVNRSIDTRMVPPTAGFVVSVATDTPWSPFIDWWKLSDAGVTVPQPGFTQVVKHAVPNSQLQTVFNKVFGAGWQPKWVDGYDVNGATFFNVVFGPRDSAFAMQNNLSMSSFDASLVNFKNQGLSIAQFDSYLLNGAIAFAAIWDGKARPPQSEYHGVSESQHVANFNSLTSQGFHPVNVSVVTIHGARLFSALWEQAAVGSFASFQTLSEADFQTQFGVQLSAGRRLTYVNGYNDGGTPRITAIWDQVDHGAFAARHAMADADYITEYNHENAQGFFTRSLSGYQRNGTTAFVGLWTGFQ